MKPAVAQALAELSAGGPGSGVRSLPDPEGGAYVIVDDVGIGAGFAPETSWIGFHITWTYPDSDVYPHFIDPTIQYVGAEAVPNAHPEGALPVALTRGGEMPGFEIPAIQVSRRSNQRRAETDSALHKLLRVVAFLREK